MGASISYKLKNSLQGALAGGGDPASSPLYVFGPFLALIIPTGVASITFGASLWLAVLTVIAVSAMYRYVMTWVTDGSGGSGLSEEEFGSWAVKINASITVIEYTLTFLVSIAALVTFVADRVPLIAGSWGVFNFRTVLAIVLSYFVTVAVNKGPKMASIFFGPATGLILLFLWVMCGAVIFQFGLELPSLDLRAFQSEHLHFTLGGFARILALMTGIEIFANLVASYQGSASVRSRKAFGSLLIVMGTTVASMLILGPAILKVSDISIADKSVFTQTMDALLPTWLSYAGTLIGIVVLLSAAAASMQGMQNLALGLRARNYIPARWGTRNKYDVPKVPSWIQFFVVVTAFLVLGTHEETFLALYAAGVFILLSMTGWSATKRFFHLIRAQISIPSITGFAISIFSAICATIATGIIFEERFRDGAWTYLVMVPLIYLAFAFFRRRLGLPPESVNRRINFVLNSLPLGIGEARGEMLFHIKKILVPLDGEPDSEFAFHQGVRIAHQTGAEVQTFFVQSEDYKGQQMKPYLQFLDKSYLSEQFKLRNRIVEGTIADEIVEASKGFDMMCMASDKKNLATRLTQTSISYQVICKTAPPILFLRPSSRWLSRSSQFAKMLIPLDGSEIAEQILPYAVSWAKEFNSQVTLLSVPEDQGSAVLIDNLKKYLAKIADNHFTKFQIPVETLVEGSGPARTILHHLQENTFDLVAMTSHGRGGLERQKYVPLGNVTEAVFQSSDVPLLFVSAQKFKNHNEPAKETESPR